MDETMDFQAARLDRESVPARARGAAGQNDRALLHGPRGEDLLHAGWKRSPRAGWRGLSGGPRVSIASFPAHQREIICASAERRPLECAHAPSLAAKIGGERRLRAENL